MSSDSSRPEHLVLVGLMGAGKTTVGERCAELLDRTFLDTDQLVEASTGMSVAELFRHDGEAQFRLLERDAITDACASPVPLVLACGGGAVLDPENRRRLRAAGLVVWLRASPAVLDERVGAQGGADRPLLSGSTSTTTTLERLSRQREPAYEATAHRRIDTEGRTVDDVAAAVIEEYRAWNA
jgi:shikimate kinase